MNKHIITSEQKKVSRVLYEDLLKKMIHVCDVCFYSYTGTSSVYILTLKCDYVTIVNIVLTKYLMGLDWLLRTQ